MVVPRDGCRQVLLCACQVQSRAGCSCAILSAAERGSPYARGLLQYHAGPADVESDEVAGVTFTATSAADGGLLVGSSREFAGFDSEPSQPGGGCL